MKCYIFNRAVRSKRVFNSQSITWVLFAFKNQRAVFNILAAVAPITVTINVNDDAINTVYDINNETFLTFLSDYMTIDELYGELRLQLKLTVIEAGLNASEPLALPVFSPIEIPNQYFINAGGEECDAANYTISDLNYCKIAEREDKTSSIYAAYMFINDRDGIRT